jgi:hypothetical protein
MRAILDHLFLILAFSHSIMVFDAYIKNLSLGLFSFLTPTFFKVQGVTIFLTHFEKDLKYVKINFKLKYPFVV